MTRQQDRRVQMLQSTYDFCSEQAALTAARPAFQKAVVRLGNYCSDLDACIDGQLADSSGVSARKRALRDRLCAVAAPIGAALQAAHADDPAVPPPPETTWTEAALKKRSAMRLGLLCSSLHAQAEAVLAGSPDAPFDAAELAALHAAVAAYREASPAPRNAIAARTGYTKELRTLLRAALRFAREQLDRLALGYKQQHPDFYLNYQARRVIWDAPVRRKKGREDGAAGEEPANED